MDIYVACPFADRDRAVALADRLRGMGHTIAYEWWKTAPEHGGKAAEAHSPRELAFIGEEEVRAVQTADLVISIFPRPSIGNLMECGMAVASDVPLLVLTTPEAGEAWRLVPFAHLDLVLVADDDLDLQLLLTTWDGTQAGWIHLIRLMAEELKHPRVQVDP